MGRLVYQIGDPEAARLLRVRAQNLARNRLMESLGWYNLENARAAKAAKHAEAIRRHEVEIPRHIRSRGSVKCSGPCALYGREKRRATSLCA